MDDRGVVGNTGDLAPETVAEEGVRDVLERALVTPAEGWDGWAMSLFDLGAGGHTPEHAHPWAHVLFVAGGRGTLMLGGEEHPLSQGSYAFVPPGRGHQVRAAPDAALSYLSIQPAGKDY